MIMNKSLIIIALCISSTAMAQKFEIGAKAGVNFSNFTGTSNWQEVKTKTLVGYHFGGLVSFFIGNSFAIQPEVLFSSQGAKFEAAGTTIDQRIYYVNLPVMLKYRFRSGFYLEAGPQFGFKTGESGKNIDSLAKNSDFSLAAGIGYHSRIGLGVGFRYTAGISKVGDFKATNSINPDFRNGVIQASLFYTLFNRRK
jgi:hypothetical protein